MHACRSTLEDPTAVPTSAGELLHSPASSSFLARLPEGGRLDAGPSSWLAFGGPRAAALLEGGFTVGAPEGSPLELDTPSGRVLVPAGGEVEISIGAAAGGSGPEWLGSWAAARRAGVEPGRPVSPPPVAPQVVFARRGTVEVALSGGPVRNMMERTTLRVGQALILLQGKAFLSTGVDDDGPPDSSRWMDGLPVPPGSRFFQRPAKAAPKPETPPGGFGAASGPVRNTLERSLGDGSTPEERAYALSVYESVGGVEAVAAAAKAVDDPAVEVRCAALRVLALTASADRPTALAALRRLARDGDAFVARFAILALKTLKDTDAVPVLRAIAVDDDAPPDTPKRGVDDDAPPGRIVAKVYALDALVALGDRSLLKEGAALLPEASKDPVLYPVLRQFVYDAMEKLSRDELRAYYADPRPGVKAAALLALEDFDLAEEALKSDSEMVRLAGAQVLLGSKHPSHLREVGSVEWSDPRSRSSLIVWVDGVIANNPSTPIPEWAMTFAHEVLARQDQSQASLDCAARILEHNGRHAAIEYTLANGTPSAQARVILSYREGLPPRYLRDALSSDNPEVRQAALFSALLWIRRNPKDPEASDLVTQVTHLPITSRKEGLSIAVILAFAGSEIHLDIATESAFAMSASPDTEMRRASTIALGNILNTEAECSRLLALSDDPEAVVSESAAQRVALLVHSKTWNGPDPKQMFPSLSSNPLVRALLSTPAAEAGVPGAVDSILTDLSLCTSRQRLDGLKCLERMQLLLPAMNPQLLMDPDPGVRIHCLLNSDAPDQVRRGALDCSEDPNLWVRAVSLAILAEAGDTDATSTLSRLMVQLGEMEGLAGKFAAGFRVDAAGADVLFSVSQMAKQALDEGSIIEADGRDSSGAAYGQALLATRGSVSRTATSLRTESEPNRRAALILDLSGSNCRQGLDVIGAYLPTHPPPSNPTTGAAVAALKKLIGFTPDSSTVDFYEQHHLGYISPLEVIEQSR